MSSTSFLIKFLQVLLLYIAIEPAKAGNIKVCARSAENTQNPVSGADVVCWDDDSWSNDDWMASGTTGSDGCAVLRYNTKTRRRWYHCTAWVLLSSVFYCCLAFNSFLSLPLSVPVSYTLGGTVVRAIQISTARSLALVSSPHTLPPKITLTKQIQHISP